MASTRLEILKGMVAQNPKDSFSRYGLAMEYRNSGDLEGALREFRELIAVNPDYAYAYFHGGQTLERMGRLEDAAEMYRAGIASASRTGDQHASGELQGALDLLS
jgi:tetratricopeptide (TPR) repeat protein